MRIAVTGSAGRLGKQCVRSLQEAGHEVLAIDVRRPEDGSAADTKVVDLNVFEGLADLFGGCEAIVHLGNHPAFGHVGRAKGFANNTISNHNVFLAAGEAGVGRIVNASSVQAYGVCSGASGLGGTFSTPLYFPIDESHPLLPADAYPLSKAGSEWILESFCRRRPELRAWSMRFTGVQTHDRKQNPSSAKYLSVPPEAQFRGSLNTFIDVEDAARAVRLCCESDRPAGHTALNIVAPRSRRPWSEEIIIKAYGMMPPLRRPITTDDALICGKRAEELIGFRAEKEWGE